MEYVQINKYCLIPTFHSKKEYFDIKSELNYRNKETWKDRRQCNSFRIRTGERGRKVEGLEEVINGIWGKWE